MKQPCVYIMASKRNGTLYTGVTANLPKRAYEHREGVMKGFSKKYGCKMLVWYEVHESMIEAITREKQIKAGSRAKKLALIEALNPEWNDLYESLNDIAPSPSASLRGAKRRSNPCLCKRKPGDWIASLRSQ
jgi:predicted GIY-YIG superfamily endonuclease